MWILINLYQICLRNWYKYQWNGHRYFWVRNKNWYTRALYRNPEILILDELQVPDDESEMSIISILNSKFKNKTKIIIHID